MSNAVRWAGLAAVAATFLTAAVLRAEEEAPPPPAEEPQSGTVTGILTAKGEGWIEVKAEGEKESRRYLPFWHGGMPDEGGGLDQAMVETIAKIPVTNLVRLEWKMEEHRRIVRLEVVKPAESSGTVTGRVVALGDTWLDLKPEGKGPTERYLPEWHGGMPADGGGLDKEMIAAIGRLRVGDTARVQWRYEERKRVVGLERIESASDEPRDRPQD